MLAVSSILMQVVEANLDSNLLLQLVLLVLLILKGQLVNLILINLPIHSLQVASQLLKLGPGLSQLQVRSLFVFHLYYSCNLNTHSCCLFIYLLIITNSAI